MSKEDSKGDVFLDAWLPNTHKEYWADYGDKLVKLGESFSEGTTGLVVPAYVTINSIEELNANKDKFNGIAISKQNRSGRSLDLRKANYGQLIKAGLPEKNIFVSEICTADHPEIFFSYRRDKGNTGRMAAIFMLK